MALWIDGFTLTGLSDMTRIGDAVTEETVSKDSKGQSESERLALVPVAKQPWSGDSNAAGSLFGRESVEWDSASSS